ncbi:MAG TPA: DUF6636 domain-containing protein [Gaiellaceae bacterium]|jgi:hypothetical protein|nr:DUF6636 domain-containing protein [Gaiellaceae bacterium]
MRALAVFATLAVLAPASFAAPLPGVKTPTRNISCFVVPIRPTTRSTLLCDIHRASYLRRVQDLCMARSSLDWHGFSLSQTGRASLVCSGGILYDVGRDGPVHTILAYGRTWHSHGFTCRSRTTGLTCTNARGHGLFLSRASYRLW